MASSEQRLRGKDQIPVDERAKDEGRRPAKILVVDDERSLVDLVRSYLEADGFAVSEAYDGPIGSGGGCAGRAPGSSARRRAPRLRWIRGVPAVAPLLQRIRADAHFQVSGDRQADRVVGGCGRLPHKALQPPRACGPGESDASPSRDGSRAG